MSAQGINLIPGPRRRAMARRARVRRWLTGSGCYAVLLIIAYAACITSAGNDVDASTAALERTNRQIDDITHSLSTLRPQMVEMQARMSVARNVGDQPDWSHLLAIVSATLDDEIVLNSTRLEASDATAAATSGARRMAVPASQPSVDSDCRLIASLQGFAKSQAAVTQFVLRLERLGLFERVEMVNSSRQQFGNNSEATAFRIECELRRGRGAGGNAGGNAGRKTR
jgi:Tfp pilus assembly protein PilN